LLLFLSTEIIDDILGIEISLVRNTFKIVPPAFGDHCFEENPYFVFQGSVTFGFREELILLKPD
jgi:hypothetical protein